MTDWFNLALLTALGAFFPFGLLGGLAGVLTQPQRPRRNRFADGASTGCMLWVLFCISSAGLLLTYLALTEWIRRLT